MGNYLGPLIYKVTASTDVAVGIAARGYNNDSILATTARLNDPRRIAADASENIFTSDDFNYRVRMVTEITGMITTVAGTGEMAAILSNKGDGGSQVSARLFNLDGIAVDADEDFYFCDSILDVVKKDAHRFHKHTNTHTCYTCFAHISNNFHSMSE